MWDRRGCTSFPTRNDPAQVPGVRSEGQSGADREEARRCDPRRRRIRLPSTTRLGLDSAHPTIARSAIDPPRKYVLHGPGPRRRWRRDRSSQAWRFGQRVSVRLGEGGVGGTVMSPISTSSCAAGMRARVAAQYLGASLLRGSAPRRGQNGSTWRDLGEVGLGVEPVQLARRDEREVAPAAALAWSSEPKKSQARRPEAIHPLKARSEVVV